MNAFETFKLDFYKEFGKVTDKATEGLIVTPYYTRQLKLDSVDGRTIRGNN